MTHFLSSLEVLDIFGQHIKLTYKNRTKFKTPCGAVLTICMAVALLGTGLHFLSKYLRSEIMYITSE